VFNGLLEQSHQPLANCPSVFQGKARATLPSFLWIIHRLVASRPSRISSEKLLRIPGRKYTSQETRLLYEAKENAVPRMSANATNLHKIVLETRENQTRNEWYQRDLS